MKLLSSAVLFGLVAAQPALARRGGGTDDVLTRGSQAWFAAETAEHEVRLLLASGALTEAMPTTIAVDLTSAATSSVVVDSTSGTFEDLCRMVDHWSRGGTVLKKEVYCDVAPGEPRNDVSRGTNAWALVEGLEHSLRLAIGADASVKDEVASVSAALEGTSGVGVMIDLTDGTTLSYGCVRRTSGSASARADLNCFVR